MKEKLDAAAPCSAKTIAIFSLSEIATNPIATIFAWSGALKKRGEMDDLPELQRFGEALEKASLATLSQGIMTKDLVNLAEGIPTQAVNSHAFILAIQTELKKILEG